MRYCTDYTNKSCRGHGNTFNSKLLLISLLICYFYVRIDVPLVLLPNIMKAKYVHCYNIIEIRYVNFIVFHSPCYPILQMLFIYIKKKSASSQIQQFIKPAILFLYLSENMSDVLQILDIIFSLCYCIIPLVFLFLISLQQWYLMLILLFRNST